MKSIMKKGIKIIINKCKNRIRLTILIKFLKYEILILYASMLGKPDKKMDRKE